MYTTIFINFIDFSRFFVFKIWSNDKKWSWKGEKGTEKAQKMLEVTTKSTT